MIKRILISSLFLSTLSLFAQTEQSNHEVNFELGSGLNFSFNNGDYQFKIGGMVQPSIAFEKQEKVDDPDYFLNARRTFFNFSGKAVQQKVSFFFQSDYSLSTPLLDAWIGYHPTERWNIYFGQKQTIGNNREMLVMENYLQFPDRSLLSTSMSNTGREFGLFMDYSIGTDRVIVPQIAITSGDGRNSFGVDSRDVDLGGLKYAARIDLYPMGKFSEGNDLMLADLAHEENVKILLGAAASFNDGASNVVGEGHGDFLLYNQKGVNQLPDYRQVYSDILVKFKGISLLVEYAVSSATNLNGTFVDITASNELDPEQIANFLALGTAMNVQLGYATKSGYAADFRYATTTPEFNKNPDSVLQEQTAMTIGLSKYFKGNALKLQTAVTSLDTKIGDQTRNTLRGELLVSVVF